jgi:hypothetical protein
VILGITGLPGGGKSLYAVTEMLKAKRAGRRVVANFHSRTNMWEYMNWEQMKELHNALVVIDEAHMWFPSRQWHKTTQDELSYFQQSRKEGLDLMWVAQHENRVDTALKELSAYYKRCSMLARTRVCRVRTVVPEDVKKVIETKFFKPSPTLFRHYWSEERIFSRDSEETGFGESAKLARDEGAGGLRMWVGADGKLHIPPNLWIVRYPFNRTVTLASSTDLAAAVAEAAAAYRSAWGKDQSWQFLVSAFYRDPFGVRHPVDIEQVVFPAEDPKAPSSVLYAALQDITRPLEKLENMELSKVAAGSQNLLRTLLAGAGYRS